MQVFEPLFRKTMEELMPQILERAKKIGAVNLGNIEHSIWMTDSEAAYSFIFGLYTATVFFASRAVEMAINMDVRISQVE